MQRQLDRAQVEVRFTLNGQEIYARVPGQMTLLRFLRDQVGPAGLDELRAAARSSRSPVIQRRAAKLVAELHHKGKK